MMIALSELTFSGLSVVLAAALGALFMATVRLAGMWRERYGPRSMRGMLKKCMVVLDAIPAPVCLRDHELRLIACNAAFAEACGQPRAALENASIETVLLWLGVEPLAAHDLERQYRNTMGAAKWMVTDRTVSLHTGTATLQHWTSPLRDTSNRVVGVLGGWLDVTERHRALAGLAEARDHAEAAVRAKSIFLAAVSHDIRTPMNTIMGMLELTLLQASLPASGRQQLNAALQSARSLLSLIDDLLDLSKMDLDKPGLRPAFVSLHDVTLEVADAFLPAADSKGVELQVEIAPSVVGNHYIDPLRLKQILNNLVSNAIRFTTHGHVRIEAMAARIHEGHQWVQFSVMDTGIGIAPEALPTLFEPFVQIGASTTHGSVGLGLSICKRLVDAMGGHIRICSTPGEGTQVTVRLRLPCQETPDLTLLQPPELTLPQPPPGANASAPILVVDDQAPNRILLGHQLQRLGHAVVFAENGLQALQAIDRQMFKLVICDCAMPQMDGMEFVRILRRRQDACARIPVLGYTAGAQDISPQDAINAGMNAVLFKPVGLKELKAALQAHLPQMPAHVARADEYASEDFSPVATAVQ